MRSAEHLYMTSWPLGLPRQSYLLSLELFGCNCDQSFPSGCPSLFEAKEKTDGGIRGLRWSHTLRKSLTWLSTSDPLPLAHTANSAHVTLVLKFVIPRLRSSLRSICCTICASAHRSIRSR